MVMNMKPFGVVSLCLIIFSACQSATTVLLIDTVVGENFTLAPEQTAIITDAGFVITLNSVGNDARCPANVECAVSGPVSVSISIQKGSEMTQFNMQTFTSEDGQAPEFTFEGIQNEVEYEGYKIRIVSVLPYPQELEEVIKPRDYRVTFMILEK